jgi:RimJ/RimL family protein N-acetyltransferase
MLTVSEPNVGGVKAYAKAGFKLEGRLREACLRNGRSMINSLCRC